MLLFLFKVDGKVGKSTEDFHQMLHNLQSIDKLMLMLHNGANVNKVCSLWCAQESKHETDPYSSGVCLQEGRWIKIKFKWKKKKIFGVCS